MKNIKTLGTGVFAMLVVLVLTTITSCELSPDYRAVGIRSESSFTVEGTLDGSRVTFEGTDWKDLYEGHADLTVTPQAPTMFIISGVAMTKTNSFRLVDNLGDLQVIDLASCTVTFEVPE